MDAGITPEQFELLLPLACQWAARTGTRHLQPRSGTIRRSDRGRPSSWRRRAGARPATLRSRDPVPEHPALRAAANATQLISPFTGGLTLRYGILIRSDCRSRRPMVVHELG